METTVRLIGVDGRSYLSEDKGLIDAVKRVGKPYSSGATSGYFVVSVLFRDFPYLWDVFVEPQHLLMVYILGDGNE